MRLLANGKKIVSSLNSEGLLYKLTTEDERKTLRVEEVFNEEFSKDTVKVVCFLGGDSGGTEYQNKYSHSFSAMIKGVTSIIKKFQTTNETNLEFYNYDHLLPIDERVKLIQLIARSNNSEDIYGCKTAGTNYFLEKVLLPMLGDLNSYKDQNNNEKFNLPKVILFTHSFGGIFAQGVENSLREHLKNNGFENNQIQSVFNSIKIVSVGLAGLDESACKDEHPKIPVLFISHPSDLLLVRRAPYYHCDAELFSTDKDFCKFDSSKYIKNLRIASKLISIFNHTNKRVNPYGHDFGFYLEAIFGDRKIKQKLRQFIQKRQEYTLYEPKKDIDGKDIQRLALSAITYLASEIKAWEKVNKIHPFLRYRD